MSLRLLGIVFDIAILALSGFYYKQWTLGPLIMLGPPVGQLRRVFSKSFLAAGNANLFSRL